MFIYSFIYLIVFSFIHPAKHYVFLQPNHCVHLFIYLFNRVFIYSSSQSLCLSAPNYCVHLSFIYSIVFSFIHPANHYVFLMFTSDHHVTLYDDTGKRCYANACHKFDVVPSSHILTKLANSKTIDCKHYGLGPRGTMALSLALVVSVKHITCGC